MPPITRRMFIATTTAATAGACLPAMADSVQPPAQLSLDGSDVSAREANRVRIQWNAVEAATGYDVRIASDGGWSRVDDVTQTTHIAASLECNRRYAIAVRTKMDRGVSEWSAPLIVVTRPPKPPAPSAVLAETLESSIFLIKWDVAAAVGSCESPGSIRVQVGQTSQGQTTAIDPALFDLTHAWQTTLASRAPINLRLVSAHPDAPNSLNESDWSDGLIPSYATYGAPELHRPDERVRLRTEILRGYYFG